MTSGINIGATLGSLVSERVYAGIFPQPPKRPTWPAIRYTLSGIPGADLCGDGGDEVADFRLQLDLVIAERSGYEALQTLRGQVMAAMAALTPPALWDGEHYDYDEETRTHRWILDYLVYPSSLVGILAEDGTFLLAEDGTFILAEYGGNREYGFDVDGLSIIAEDGGYILSEELGAILQE